MYYYQYLFFLIGLALLLFAWFESLRIHEHTVRTCRRICEESDLQLLDQTVSLGKISLSRSGRRWLSVHRVYSFEVSSSGTDRLRGYATVDGRKIVAVQIENPEGMTIIYPNSSELIH